MERLRVVGLSEPVGTVRDHCVGLEFFQDAGVLRVEEVFEALQQYLEQHRDEFHQHGPQHVRVSLVRSVSPTGQRQWRARDQRIGATA